MSSRDPEMNAQRRILFPTSPAPTADPADSAAPPPDPPAAIGTMGSPHGKTQSAGFVPVFDSAPRTPSSTSPVPTTAFTQGKKLRSSPEVGPTSCRPANPQRRTIAHPSGLIYGRTYSHSPGVHVRVHKKS